MGRRHTTLAIVLVALVVAVPLVVYVWGRRSDSFTVRHVEVSGQQRVPRRELVRTLAGAYIGRNLFAIGEGDVRKTLSVFPYISDVDVDRDFPDTLRVHVSEYRPAALLHSGQLWFVVSADGHVLAQLDVRSATTPSPSPRPSASTDKSASPRPDATTPVVASPSPSATAFGPPPAGDLPHEMWHLPAMQTEEDVSAGDDVSDERVRVGLDLLAALPSALRKQARVVKVGETNARVTFADRLQVEFGDAVGVAAKIAALKAVLARYRSERRRATFVDVSVPGRPVAAPLLATPSPR